MCIRDRIITQKFIAQTPYLVLEMWSDFRRLGLPFFEIPANESSMTGSDKMCIRDRFNTVNYLEQAGQPYPIFMRQDSLIVKFTLKEPAKNARLYYLTTGHGLSLIHICRCHLF